MLVSASQQRPFDPNVEIQPAPALRVVPREARVAVMLNANAKQVNEKVRREFAQLVPEQDLYFSTSLEQAEHQAQQLIDRRYQTVLVGGGDGTIVSTINLLLKAAERSSLRGQRHTLPDLGLLKLGTGNGLAHMTGSGKPLADAARLLDGERPNAHPLRLIQCGDKELHFPFGSVGYDAQVLNDYVDLVNSTQTTMGKKMAKTLAGYFYAVGTRTIPTEFKAERARLRILGTGRNSIIDPETGEEIALEKGATLFEGVARAVLFGTSPFYGYGMKVLPFARRRTDRFHLRVSTASISYVLSHLPSIWKGTARTPDFIDFLVEGVQIQSSEELPLQMAGDAGGRTKELNLQLSQRVFRILEGSATPNL